MKLTIYSLEHLTCELFREEIFPKIRYDIKLAFLKQALDWGAFNCWARSNMRFGLTLIKG